MNKIIIIVVAIISVVSQCFGQKNETPYYNYNKAYAAFYDEKDPRKALGFLDKQIESTPMHIESRYFRARIYWENGLYDCALQDLDFITKKCKDKSEVTKTMIYNLYGHVYLSMQFYDKSADSFLVAIKSLKKEEYGYLQGLRFDYAQALYCANNIDAAEAVYQEMLKDNPYDAPPMICIVRNRINAGNLEDAKKWLEKAERCNPEYDEVYKYKMELFVITGRIDEAIDASVKYFELYEDKFSIIGYVAKYIKLHYTYGVAKVKSKISNDGDRLAWMVLLSVLYSDHCDYKSSIKMYDKIEEEYGVASTLFYYRAKWYSHIGQYNQAIENVDKVIEQDDDVQNIILKGDIYKEAGAFDKAIDEYAIAIEKDPTYGYNYYATGWCWELKGDNDKALEFYNQGIDLDKTYAYLFYSRGYILMRRGKKEEAKSDFDKVLEMDTIPECGSCRQFVLQELGRDTEALQWADKILENEPYDPRNYYNRACLFARMGKTDEAMAALDTAFQKGYCRFSLVDIDRDLESLRNLPEFTDLVNKYKSINVTEEINATSENNTAPSEVKTSEIKMKRNSAGTFEVPCSINGLPLKFILDTGASDVTISNVEADFMLKNDYLSQWNIKGSRNYLTADGTISEGTVICLREVVVGDVVLKNIEASVVKNQKAPLLLGQSVLERFGKIYIDNENSILTIKQRK